MIMVETTLITCERVEMFYFSTFLFANIDGQILIHIIRFMLRQKIDDSITSSVYLRAILIGI